jgi:hypothetical protein
MAEGPVIIAYTDEMAVADGVLVPWSGPGGVNRVTRAVFDAYTDPMGQSRLTGAVTDVTRLSAAIQATLAAVPDQEGWRTHSLDGRELWLVPNELGGLTLMFPEDY